MSLEEVRVLIGARTHSRKLPDRNALLDEKMAEVDARSMNLAPASAIRLRNLRGLFRNLIEVKTCAILVELDPFGPRSPTRPSIDRPPWLNSEPLNLGFAKAGEDQFGDSRSDWCPCPANNRHPHRGIAGHW